MVTAKRGDRPGRQVWCPRLPLQSEARALGRLPVQDTDEQQKYVTLFALTCWEDTPTSATVTDLELGLATSAGRI